MDDLSNTSQTSAVLKCRKNIGGSRNWKTTHQPPASFITNAHNELYASYTGKKAYRKKILSQ